MSEADFSLLAALESELAGDERWQLATRITSSRSMAKAAQQRELLLFLVKKAILSPGAEISEQEIGSQVLGRRPDYDTQADNIVRVQMRHLRHKLEEYFAGEGSQERLVLTIPKGGRIPEFTQRAEVEVPVATEKPAGRAGPRTLWMVLAAVLLAGTGFLAGRYGSGRASGSAIVRRDEPNPLLARLFQRGDRTTIVIADSTFVVIQDILGTDLRLQDYTKHPLPKLIETVPDASLRGALEEIASRQYTSLADATISGKLSVIGRQAGADVSVRYARHMAIRDFNAGNFVIVGSKRGAPWVELFEGDLNFRHAQYSKDRRFGFVNRKPLKGEPAVYATSIASSGSGETYGTIAYLPNVTKTGSVLLLDGIMMEATEAAGEFCMSSGFAKQASQWLGATSAEKLPYFEMLLKIQAVSGAPRGVEVVAVRRPKVD